MVSSFMWKNKDTPLSKIGEFVICENIWVLMSPVSEVCNALYNAQAFCVALSLFHSSLEVTLSVSVILL